MENKTERYRVISVLLAQLPGFSFFSFKGLCRYGYGLNLFNRKQYCREVGIDVKIGKIKVDVPQESCLGPFLFLIYINDLPKVVLASTVSMYADNTSLTFQSKNISQVSDTLINGLKRLGRWIEGNKLSLNMTTDPNGSVFVCTGS